MKNYLIVIGLTIPLIVNAQDVITTNGGNMSNNIVNVNWTIGEPIIEMASNTEIVNTSGINQPNLMFETLVENLRDILEVSLFPNPTPQCLNVSYSGKLPFYVKIISLDGTVISKMEIKDKSSQIDFSKNKCGIYILEIADKYGKTNTYKIVKQ